MTVLTVRDATLNDLKALCDLINDIIAAGGTTAHQRLFTVERFKSHYIAGPHVLTCLVATDDEDRPLGFQALSQIEELPTGWGDIATFVSAASHQRGVGTALFAATRARAVKLGLAALNATIRADNAAGQAYYGTMGFEIYDIQRAVPLRDGTPVDRISRRLMLR